MFLSNSFISEEGEDIDTFTLVHQLSQMSKVIIDVLSALLVWPFMMAEMIRWVRFMGSGETYKLVNWYPNN